MSMLLGKQKADVAKKIPGFNDDIIAAASSVDVF